MLKKLVIFLTLTKSLCLFASVDIDTSNKASNYSVKDSYVNLNLESCDISAYLSSIFAIKTYKDNLKKYASNGNYKDLNILLSFFYRPDVNLPLGELNDSALIYASRYQGNVQTINLLLEYGADANYVNKLGQTALLEAIMSLKPKEFIYLLLDSGAQINIIDKNKQSILDHVSVLKEFWIDFPSRKISKENREKNLEYIKWIEELIKNYQPINFNELDCLKCLNLS